ncbi:MAG: hypothetical protein E7593_03800 [Ruminococcaceae bacterium]|nr:hypothetical protein [Oscillospiraceae bacterium]
MKKLFISFLAFLIVLSLASCNVNLFSPNNISHYLTEENGNQYLILPISKDKVLISDTEAQYLNDINVAMLKSAEEKISEEASKYPDDWDFYISIYEGQLCLCTEIIVDIEPPENPKDGLIGGCGIDHEHIFIRERITK